MENCPKFAFLAASQNRQILCLENLNLQMRASPGFFIFASHIKHEIKPLLIIPPLAHSGQKNETLPQKNIAIGDTYVDYCYFSYQTNSVNVRSFLILPKGMRSGGDSTKAANN